ncbi:glycosyltransferase family 2 protein [Anaerocolumna aminovalerica]|uniref:Dolichol-phosphate mannosyltransferase n=1 Tax=Anaerocolumna aminovalerica TaxID=1527 RepID=A0A1I5EFF0_9FIRM|nr:glycosyltransferase family 2 protein [Anaerocolumna aminovalerica]SFO10224.1 dolichol-phosphate mannosyltransferase [Anaerocolumna aminovalerica]
MKKISVIVSVYNEEKVLNDFYIETKNVLEQCCWDFEIIFVNDGSHDNSLALLNEIVNKDNKVKVISFSKNFGHEAAMIAGIDYSSGDGVVCMDADLQHPPELIPKIIEKFNEGYEVISMVRTKNQDAGLLKNITSTMFYKILNMMSPVKFENNASDFFAIASNAANVLKKEYRERMRFLRGYVQIIGFNKIVIEYEANDRRAGESKYSIKKLVNFSINALLSFSDLPLKLGIFSGLIVAIIGFILMIYTIYTKLVYNAPSGYATIIVVLCFMFSLMFIIIGIIGEYIAIIFAEIKNRPIYIIKETKNLKSIDESEE